MLFSSTTIPRKKKVKEKPRASPLAKEASWTDAGDADVSELGGKVTDGSIKGDFDFDICFDEKVLVVLGRRPTMKERVRQWLIGSQWWRRLLKPLCIPP